jgi:hypothetical protein
MNERELKYRELAMTGTLKGVDDLVVYGVARHGPGAIKEIREALVVEGRLGTSTQVNSAFARLTRRGVLQVIGLRPGAVPGLDVATYDLGRNALAALREKRPKVGAITAAKAAIIAPKLRALLESVDSRDWDLWMLFQWLAVKADLPLRAQPSAPQPPNEVKDEAGRLIARPDMPALEPEPKQLSPSPAAPADKAPIAASWEEALLL